MLSEKIADLSETVLGEERIPADLRADFALLLADYAEQVAAMFEGVVPARFRSVPSGCIDFTAERRRRGMRPRAEVLS